MRRVFRSYACGAQIAARNAPSVFDVNARPEAEARAPKQEEGAPMKAEPKLEPPGIVSKWTLVDYDAEEKPRIAECVLVFLLFSF